MRLIIMESSPHILATNWSRDFVAIACSRGGDPYPEHVVKLKEVIDSFIG